MTDVMELNPGQKVQVRFNGHWYPGVVVRTTPKRVEARFWTRGGERERVKIVPRDYVRPENAPTVKASAVKESLWLKADGTNEIVFPKGKLWTLEEMQALVGGYIEPIRSAYGAEGKIMFADEDGRSKGLPANAAASRAAGQTIVGNVLVTPEELVQ